jgi:hypothetical protein
MRAGRAPGPSLALDATLGTRSVRYLTAAPYASPMGASMFLPGRVGMGLAAEASGTSARRSGAGVDPIDLECEVAVDPIGDDDADLAG